MKPPACPRAFGPPLGRARLKAVPEDFQVEEILGFEPSGDGEHVFLWVEKRGRNTEDVALALARFAGVPRQRVSYAGLKDRQALTRQWFCVHLPGGAVPWADCRGEGFSVCRWIRNRRRLRKGALQGNRFRLRLRDFAGDRAGVEARLAHIGRRGMPNYFGTQRFGRDGANLARAAAMLQGDARVRSRHRRGLYLSAARAAIFNRVLALRVAAGCWDRAVPGDLLQFDGSGAYFAAERPDDDIEARVAALALHPTGPLWGRGERATGAAGAWERQAAAEWPALAAGLENGTAARRRPLRVRVAELDWHWEGDALVLAFALPAGSYATVLIHELLDTGEETP